ncbi:MULTISPECIES: hypothetical protein [Bacillus]|uniref:Uncharacterized protein n=1 Tax=Bacillus cereus TaxID=1396 RepID=A0A9X6W2K3_BACCE|nr:MULTISPECIES: hypothetical protein [Bacillus cereus group]PEZ74850.1 hypothetical protein CN410_11970 [Bacillus anthracis]KXY51296.1 hypothetical protein AT268_32965 [Bacillus cereus]PES55236.1 hypothetical protein CN515_04065 [Bacillus cereus]PFA29634.1 hypothetical protein CN384_08085 [Bacillus thuringiensis]PFF51724.1 hypothetical protein CN357_03235 [Bacillus cereus]
MNEQLLTKEEFALKITDKSNINGIHRLGNTLVIGSKNTGKTTEMLPLMAQQDINNKECGATFIVGRKDISCMLYGMAKKAKRKVVFLKPSIDEKARKILEFKSYEYNRVKEEVIDYEEVISKKMIVIIDMEYVVNGDDGIRATAMLLSQLQLSMQVNEDAKVSPHFVYIDDSQYYLPFVELLLSCGDDYCIGSTLFMQSKKQMIDERGDYEAMLEPNINNFVFMNSLIYEDSIYYQKQQVYYSYKEFVGRGRNEIICETKNEKGERSVVLGILNLVEDAEDCMRIGLNHKKKMMKKMPKIEREQGAEKIVQLQEKQKPIQKSIEAIHQRKSKKKQFLQTDFESDEEY